MAKTLKEKVLEVAELVYDLNKSTQYQWFFDYSGHIDTIMVHYVTQKQKKCPKCSSPENESVYLCMSLDCKKHTELNDLIKKLKSF